MTHRGEACVGFVVAGGDPTERFELAEEILDQIAPPVHCAVSGNSARPVGLGRDHGQGASFIQFGPPPAAVEGFVAKQGLEIDAGDQGLDTDAVMALARQEEKRARLPSASTNATILLVRAPRERPRA